MKRWWPHALVVAAILVLPFACSSWSAPPVLAPGTAEALVQDERMAMGSILRLSAFTRDEPGARAAFEEIGAEFNRLDTLLSVWQPGSDVLRVNAAAGSHPERVSPDTIEIFDIARQVSEWTEGKFDVTFGALSDVWKFDQDQDDTVPTPQQIAARLPLIDYRELVTDHNAGTAFLRRAGMRAHLGGIGKGYAVDKAIAIFRRRGLADFMIQAGGDLYVGGKKGGRPWRLGIQDPRGPGDDSFATIDLSDRTFSTSGDYERAFLKDGVRYHHILDPATGQPARGCRSVTLVSERAVLADAVAKGVFILGPEKGMALIERLPGIEGVIVSAKNEVLVSSGLKASLTIRHQPADSP
jgi:thiamine biosynthesis lipoprotein